MEAVTNATFNNISVISWRSVFFSVEETGVPGENHPLRVLNNLRVKWYIWSPNRRSLCIYPGLWLALYIEAALTFFFFFLFFLYQSYYFWYYFVFHTTFSTNTNTKFCTMVVASTGFSKKTFTYKAMDWTSVFDTASFFS